jgi:hypothetical protein
LATRAIFTFIDFPGFPECHLYLHHDGYPTGAAWRFAAALRETPESASFLAAFLSTQPRAEPIQCPERAADAEYCYRVQLDPGPEPQLQVQCWRRIPEVGAFYWTVLAPDIVNPGREEQGSASV